MVKADRVEMWNGDCYNGQVLGISADRVTFQSQILGEIVLPRAQVASLSFHAKNGPADVNLGVCILPALSHYYDYFASQQSNFRTPASSDVFDQFQDFARRNREQISGDPLASEKQREIRQLYRNLKLRTLDSIE